MKRRLTFLIVTLSIFVLGYGARGSAQQPSAAALPAATGAPAVSQSAAASPAAAHQAVLSKYCYVCHNDRVKSGGLALIALDISAPAKNSESWEKVIRKLGTGAMPPAAMPRPDKATADGLRRYLETALDGAALAHPNPGRPGLQRLNRGDGRTHKEGTNRADIAPQGPVDKPTRAHYPRGRSSSSVSGETFAVDPRRRDQATHSPQTNPNKFAGVGASRGSSRKAPAGAGHGCRAAGWASRSPRVQCPRLDADM